MMILYISIYRQMYSLDKETFYVICRLDQMQHERKVKNFHMKVLFINQKKWMPLVTILLFNQIKNLYL